MAHGAWRTSKHRDLVRLLAVHAGTVLPVDQVVDILWPDAEPTKARTSFRTALSRVRRLLGDAAVERVGDGVRLGPAWIDVGVYETRVATARRLLAEDHHIEGIATAKEAIALRLGPLLADSPYAGWADAERTRLERLHASILVEAADAALESDLLHDAVELAELALSHDPALEPAARAAMTAAAWLGDTAGALRTFEELRSSLVEGLGVDPSAATDELHRRILDGAENRPRSRGPQVRTAPHIGREAPLSHLVASIGAALSPGRGGVVVVYGPRRAGTSRLITEALAALPHGTVIRRSTGTGPLVARFGSQPGVDVLDEVTMPTVDEVESLARTAAASSSVVVVGAHSERRAQRDDPSDVESATFIPLEPLGLRDAGTLVEHALGAAPDPSLVATVFDQTQGWPGRVLDTLETWRDEGRLASTTGGLALAPGRASIAADSLLLRQACEARTLLAPEEQEVLDVLAVAGHHLSHEALAGLLAEPLGTTAVSDVVDRLEAAGVLRVQPGHISITHPLIGLAIGDWLRPARRRALHEMLVDEPTLPCRVRADHAAAVGCAERAVELYLRAGEHAASARHDTDMRSHLLAAWSMLRSGTLPAPRRTKLHQRLADLAVTAGWTDTAAWIYDTARRLAAPRTRPAELVPAGAEPDADEPTSMPLGLLAHTVREQSWPTRDLVTVAHLRSSLAGADVVAAGPGWIAGELAVLDGEVWAGDARHSLPRLRRVRDAIVTSGDDDAAFHADVLLGHALHELDHVGFADVWERAASRGARHRDASLWHAAAAGVAAERGEIDAAEVHVDLALARPASTAIGLPLAMRALARLRERQGRPADAVAALSAAVEGARRTGHRLLLPELAARLAILEAGGDPDGALGRLELAEGLAGQHRWFARERAWLLMATAVVRHGRTDPELAQTFADRAEAAALGAGLRWQQVHLREIASEWEVLPAAP